MPWVSTSKVVALKWKEHKINERKPKYFIIIFTNSVIMFTKSTLTINANVYLINIDLI